MDPVCANVNANSFIHVNSNFSVTKDDVNVHNFTNVYTNIGLGSGTVVSMLNCQLRFFRVQIQARAEIWILISAPTACPSQLSYDEYTDLTLSVER